MTSYPLLFSPLQIGEATLQNRVVMLPHGTCMLAEGALTEDDIAYYEVRARTRPGMMVTGASVVSPDTTRRAASCWRTTAITPCRGWHSARPQCVLTGSS